MADINALGQLAALESNMDVDVPGLGGGSMGGGMPQQQAAPQQFGPREMLAMMNKTPLGHPSFAAGRMRPGGQSPGVNPMTGQQFGNYQEFMATRAPDAFANSLTGRGQMPMQAPQVPGQSLGSGQDYASLVRQYLAGGR